MANTFSSLNYHVIFSTKGRANFIRQDIEARIWSYLGGIARENKMKAIEIGGIENHVHLLLAVPPAISLSSAVQLIKGGASKWVKEEWRQLRGFGWQDGYAAFSVSKSHLPDVTNYIKNQREHHRVKSFEEEYRAFLHRHELNFDERYAFDSNDEIRGG